MSESVPHIGTVIALKGQVWAESDHGERPLEMDGVVYEGEKIHTGPDSNVEIRFLDDTLLSQSSDSTLSLNDYVYNADHAAGSNLSFGLLQGAFRHVSGKIAETNPENVQLESPLAVIGIRGTVTVHRIDPDGAGETHGVESIGPNHRVIIQDSFGEIRIISQPLTMVDVSPDSPMAFIRPMTPQEFEFFHSFAPGVLDLTGLSATPEGAPEDMFGTGGEPGQGGTEDDSHAVSGQKSQSVPEAGATKSAIADYEDQSGDAPDSGQDAQNDDPDVGPTLTVSSGADLLLPPEALGAGLNLFSSTPDTVAPPQDDPYQPDPGTDPSIGNPSNWESMTSGGHPDYSWLPAGYTAVPGTDGNDVIQANTNPGGSGPFALFGFEGDDMLEASANHIFYGGAGNDTVVAGAGDNTVYGGTGNDEVEVGAGDNSVDGGDGADTVITGSGANTVLGGAGDDTIVAAAGHASNDSIDGGTGNDVLRLLAGTHIQNVLASDTGLRNIELILLSGASGVDLTGQTEGFEVGFEGSADLPVTVIGGAGNDLISGGTNDDSLLGASGNDSIYGGLGNDFLDGGSGNDELWGGEGNDTIQGGDGGNFIAGGDGEDSLSGDAGNDTIYGETGDDYIDGGDGDDIIYGVGDNDTIFGGSGHDLITGDDGDDSIDGGADADTVTGGAGSDTILGGAGDDVFNFQVGDVASGEVINGGQGTDTIRVEATADFSGTQITNIEYISISANQTATFAVDDAVSWTVVGASGSDEIFRVQLGSGGESIDLSHLGFTTWDGSDLVSVQGGNGNDTIIGSAANNSIEGGAGDDVLDCGPGNDTILGGLGNDSLYGYDGTDSLVGGDDDDTIEGATGADSLAGGAGDDEFIYTSVSDSRTGDGVDTITDFTSGQDTIRLVELSTKTTFIYRGTGDFTGTDAQARLDGNMLLIDVDGDGVEDMRILLSNSPSLAQSDFIWVSASSGSAPDDNPDNWETLSHATDLGGGTPNYTWFTDQGFLILDGDDNANTDSGSGSDNHAVFGYAGNDGIDGSASSADNYCFGGAGDDTVVGGSGDDTIYGGTGNDSIVGGAGVDTIVGGDGNDILWAGDDSDGDSLSGGSGNDELHCSTDGGDTLDGGAGNDTLHAAFYGADSLIGGEGIDWVDFSSNSYWVNVDLSAAVVEAYNSTYANDTLEGIENVRGSTGGDNIVGNDQANVLDGNAEDDWLEGGAGNDTLIGGDGHDIAVYAGNTNGFVFGTDGAGRFTVTDNDPGDGDEGADVLEGIEQVQFGDGLISLNTGGEFRVNTYTLGEQEAPSVASLAGGGYVVTWMSYGQESDNYGIFAQRFAADGSQVGDEFHVNSQTIADQGEPSVAALSDGGFVITWQSAGQDGDGLGVFAQRFAADGSTEGGEFQVNTNTADGQSLPSVTALSDGGFVITWQSEGQDGDGLGIYGQRFAADGSAVDGEFQVNTHVTSTQGSPSATALSDGGFVITWMSAGQDGSHYGIYAQRYQADGSTTGGEFQVSTHTLDDQAYPTVAVLSGGGFVVTWQSFDQDGDETWGVFAQRFDATGTPVGAEFHVNTYTTSLQTTPAVASLSDGGFVITWESAQGAYEGIYAKRFDASGNTVGDEFQVYTYQSGTSAQIESSVASLSDGGFVITWQSRNQDGNGWGIYAQRYTVDGDQHELELLGNSDANTLTWSGNQSARILGLEGDDSLTGGDGNDYIDGDVGNDSITGGAGDDVLISRIGVDTLTGGVGNDEFIYMNLAYSRTGDGVDTITDFTSGEDEIRLRGLSTKTTFIYQGSDAFVVGDHAQARLDGNMLLIDVDGDGVEDMRIELSSSPPLVGSDLIWIPASSGSAPDDNPDNWETYAQHGGGVPDFSWFLGRSFDVVYDTVEPDYNNTLGGMFSANTALFGFDGNDDMTALGTGDHMIYGGAGDDTITGGAWDSTIYGGTGNDTIQGGAGNEDINGGQGNDSILAGDGDDWIQGSPGVDTIDGGAGGNTIEYALSDAVDVDLRRPGAQFGGLAEGDILSNISKLYGSNFNDTLTGTESANVMGGSDGDDLIQALGGDDWMEGGLGTDTIYAGAGNDFIQGDGENEDPGDGDDLIYGEAGNDTIHGRAGNDTIDGGDGEDSLNGGAGDDSILGGAHDDWIMGSAGADTIDGGGDNNTVDYYYSDEAVSVDLGLSSSQSGGDAGGDELSNIHNLYGSWSGNDTLIGTDGENSIGGSAGHDAINGLGGDDWIEGGQGNDTIYGEYGNDFIQGDGAAEVDPDDGNDMIFGDDGDDTIHGRSGDDTLDGGYDWDSVFGGVGNDVIYGGDADNDALDGGDGQDTLSYWSEGAPFSGPGLNITLPEPGDWGTAYLFNSHEDNITNFEHLIGNAWKNEYLIGNSLDNFIRGGGGTLRGMGGNDTLEGMDDHQETLEGGEGDDLLSGLGNNDRLEGDGGADTMSGGNGNDTLYGGTGDDSIDGGAGDDLLHDGNVTVGGGAGNDTIIGGAGDDSIYAYDGANSLEGGLDDDYIHGGHESDTLYGGLGADTLSGGGDDVGNVFVYTSINDSNAEYGVDVINDFVTGTDQLDFEGLLQGSFAYRGENAFLNDGNSEARLEVIGANSVLHVNVDGADGADMEITLMDVTGTGLAETDFSWS